jgi:hypothetical protein
LWFEKKSSLVKDGSFGENLDLSGEKLGNACIHFEKNVAFGEK